MQTIIGFLAFTAVAVNGKPAGDIRGACAVSAANHGCSAFCGYEAVLAGEDYLCLPTSKRASYPFPIADDDLEEECQLVAANHGCCDTCGFKWDPAVGECRTGVSNEAAKSTAHKNGGVDAAPIIGGSGKFRYQYMPELLVAPPSASLVNCHGLAIDAEKNIYLTYQNDGKDQNCLIRWKPDGTDGVFMTGNGNTSTLCSGTPHGLKITTENGVQYLYHANNNMKLTKTTLDGKIIWQVNGFFGQNTTQYRPTWFATPPDSEITYLCDGYGSNNVYAFNRLTGEFLNKTWGGHSPGKGPAQPHGTFSTNHGCTYDERTPTNPTIIVSDRANSRLEFFNYDPRSDDEFKWYHTVDLQPAMGTGTLPCNIRMYPEQDGRAIVPDLAGPVAVLDASNTVISVVNVSVLLAEQQHKHPHDAVFLPNGDMVVATWNPGRISYWKLLPTDDELAEQ